MMGRRSSFFGMTRRVSGAPLGGLAGAGGRAAHALNKVESAATLVIEA